MGKINLEDAAIEVNGEWFTAEDLTRRIQEKMESGDMKFADLAAALEELKKAIDASHTLEIKTVITKDEYQQLIAVGGGDDRECVKKAILSFIGQGPSAAGGGAKKGKIKCANCQSMIEIPPGERPTEIRCPKCNAVGRLKAKA